MLHFKASVAIRVFTPQLAELFAAASLFSLIEGIGVEINSVDDGRHGATTLHGRSLASDLDTDGDRPEHLGLLWRHLAAHLGPGWTVILEGDHVHVEWDTNRRLPKAAAPAPRPGPAAPV